MLDGISGGKSCETLSNINEFELCDLKCETFVQSTFDNSRNCSQGNEGFLSCQRGRDDGSCDGLGSTRTRLKGTPSVGSSGCRRP